MKLPFALLFAAASPVWAQEGAPEQPEPGVALMRHGELTALDRAARTFTIDTPQGPEEFTLIEGGTVLEGGRQVDFDALAVGQQLAVEAIQDETDRQLARTIQIVDAKELRGQLEDRPAFDLAETVTVDFVDGEGARLRVRSAEGPLVYEIGDATRIQRARERTEPDELAPGERVVVSADEKTRGRFVARSIVVVSAADAAVRLSTKRRCATRRQIARAGGLG
jgi:hypothetical protein